MGRWFPLTRDNGSGWRLDVVSLLAVIGESSMENHSQPMTSTWLCLLPRLIPAPEALLKTRRPTRLPPKPALIVGVFSGTRVDELNFYGNLIHPIGKLNPLEFHEYTITRSSNGDIEDEDNHRTGASLVFVRFFGPLNIITVFSFVATLLLIMWASLIHDGVALLSLGLMALTSVLVGFAFWWNPELTVRPSRAAVVPGDVVIRTREGAFVVVHCSEEIARELYTGTEEAKYRVGDNRFKALVGVGTLTLMIGVVLLGNASWTMQAAIGGTYLVLNGAYWAAALLPPSWTWDMSHYRVVKHSDNRYMVGDQEGGDGVKPNYTMTLWQAVQATKEVEWIWNSGAAPKTDAWMTWLRLAYQNRDNPNWNAVGEKDRLMGQHVMQRMETNEPFSKLLG